MSWMFLQFRNNIALVRIAADLSSREGMLVCGFFYMLQNSIDNEFNIKYMDMTPITILCLKYYYNLAHVIEFACKLFSHKLKSVDSTLLNILLDHCKQNPNSIYKLLQIVKDCNHNEEQTNETALIMKAFIELCSTDGGVFDAISTALSVFCNH
eukprot:221048_1